jgi:hypothetical protein
VARPGSSVARGFKPGASEAFQLSIDDLVADRRRPDLDRIGRPLANRRDLGEGRVKNSALDRLQLGAVESLACSASTASGQPEALCGFTHGLDREAVWGRTLLAAHTSACTAERATRSHAPRFASVSPFHQAIPCSSSSVIRPRCPDIWSEHNPHARVQARASSSHSNPGICAN